MKQLLADISAGHINLKSDNIQDPLARDVIDSFKYASWDPEDPDPAIIVFGDMEEYYNKIRAVGLANDGTINKVLATWDSPQVSSTDTDGSQGQCMAEFPKLYYKEILNPQGALKALIVSDYPVNGLDPHIKYTWGGGRDHIYSGMYEASTISDILSSVSGQSVTTNETMSTFQSRAAARGDGWHAYDFWTQHLIETLFYVYYANRDSQAVLPGYTEEDGWSYSKTRETGRSDVLTTVNGSVDADLAGVDSDLTNLSAGDKIANRFLFVENIFGHIWKFLYGCAFDGRIGKQKTCWATPDYRLFSTSENIVIANYDNLNVDLLSVDTVSYIKSLGKHLLPVAGGASSSTYYCAQMWSYLTDAADRDYLRSVRAGGRLADGAAAGLAARASHTSLWFSYTNSGSRLCFEKLNNT